MIHAVRRNGGAFVKSQWRINHILLPKLGIFTDLRVAFPCNPEDFGSQPLRIINSQTQGSAKYTRIAPTGFMLWIQRVLPDLAEVNESHFGVRELHFVGYAGSHESRQF